MTLPSIDASRLYRFVARVLEETAFLFASPTEPQLGSDDDVVVELEFFGPSDGYVILSAAQGLGPALAAGMLGSDEGDPDVAKSAEDAVAEFTNVVTGFILLQLYGTDVVCRLGTPKVISAAVSRRGMLAVRASLLVDDAHALSVGVCVYGGDS